MQSAISDYMKNGDTDFVSSDLTKIRILKALTSDELTLRSLQRQLGTDYQTLRKLCNFLQLLSLVNITTKKTGTKKITFIEITEEGRAILKKK